MLGIQQRSIRNSGLVLTLALAPLPACADTLLGAITALDAGHYEQAYATLESMAQGGDHAAEYTLCTLYSAGAGRTRDEARAFEWCKRAAVGGVPGAQQQLGFMYLHGKGTESDQGAAMDWLARSTGAGYQQASATLDRKL